MTVLTSREGAGLFLVRRARTLAGANQIRWIATAFFALLLADLIRLHVSSVIQQTMWVEPLGLACEAATYLALAMAVWRPGPAAVVALVPLFTGLAVGTTGLEPLLLVVVVATVTAREPRRTVVLTLAGAGLYLVARMLLDLGTAWLSLAVLGVTIGLGAAAGFALRWTHHLRGRDARRHAEIAREDARLRADERRLLARELHDVVAHQVSNMSLQVMGHSTSDDPAELRGVLSTIKESSASAMTELRLLVRVLRDDPGTGAGEDEVSELTHRIAPTAAAAEATRRLAADGFEPVVSVPAQADRLEMTVQRTISRAIAELTGNVLQHGPARSRCRIELTLNSTQVTLQVSNPLPGDPGPVQLGWGLRALRERVDLSGGRLTVRRGPGVDEEWEWTVIVTLPHD